MMLEMQILRKKRGLTQQQLADRSNLSVQAVRKYETGERDIRKASYINLLAITKALDCTIDELLNESERRAADSAATKRKK